MSTFTTIAIVILIATVGGFFVGLGTELVLGRASAHKYPGGSLVVGLTAGVALQAGAAPIIVGAVFGVVGWILYRLLLPVRS